MKNEMMFTPFKIGSCEIPNRFAVTAMLTGLCGFDGCCTEEYSKYIEARAKGGFGLIITEDFRICPAAANSPKAAGLWEDRQIEGFKKLTETVHSYGSKIFCQIYHAGRQTCHWVTGEQPVGASPIPCPTFKEIPHELTVDEIHDIVRLFGESAARVKAAGFDGLEVHAGNGYLLAGFMSVYQNKRTDEYGGCFNNRMRFMHEVYDALRANVGPDFPISIRFSAEEHTLSGRMLNESRMVARELEAWGVDLINCSNGVYSSYIPMQSANLYHEHAWALKNARELKSFLKIPVLGSNGVDDPLMAETFVQDGWCDIMGMARCSLADPDMPAKAQRGDYDLIRPCLRCMKCFGALVADHVACCVNPETGMEAVYTYADEPEKKKVLIIGGGPGGLEAAIAAKRRGHDVTLFEATDSLGGQFLTACYPPSKGDHITFLTYLINDAKRLGVNIELNHRATAEEIRNFGADRVILATGAVPTIPDIPGIDSAKVHIAENILRGRDEVMGKIAVIGGGETACETALYLAAYERGSVTLVARRDVVPKGCDGNTAYSVRKAMRDYEVNVMTETPTLAVTEKGLLVLRDGAEKELAFDAVICAAGYTSLNGLASELADLGDKLTVIGDAAKVRDAMAAAAEGYKAGYFA